MNSQLTYNKWFSIALSHDYFQKGVFDNFSILPAESTLIKQRNYDIKISQQGNLLTFYVGGQVTGDVFTMNNALAGLDELVFELQMKDILFNNYTDIPWTIEPYVILLVPKEQNRFTVNTYVNKDDCIPRRSSVFSYKLPKQCQKLSVINSNGDMVISNEFDQNLPEQFFINLLKQEEGVYSILIDDELMEKFYFSSNPFRYTTCVLQIPVKKLLTQLESKSPQNIYEIAFSARKCFWQYEVVVNPNRKLITTQMDIKGVGDESYDSPVQKTLPGGNVASVFKSSIPIRLADRPNKYPLLTLKYKFNYSNQAHELEIKLPTPEILSMRKYEEGEDGMSFLSTKIINV